MFSAASLNDHHYRDWRDAEEAVFSVMERLRRGQTPSLEGASPAALRRLGYLADLILLFLDPEQPDLLRSLVDDVRSRLEGRMTEEALSAVPYARRRSQAPGFDDVGAAWKVAPGVSLARYKTESPTFPHS